VALDKERLVWARFSSLWPKPSFCSDDGVAPRVAALASSRYASSHTSPPEALETVVSARILPARPPDHPRWNGGKDGAPVRILLEQ